MKHSAFWINSIDSPDNYSGGPLLKPYTTPWGQNPFDDKTVATYADFIYPSSDISQSQHRLTIAVAGGDDEVVLARYAGCVMIGLMPSQGLPEVLESLRDMWEFYNEQTKAQPQHPRLPQRIDATVVGHKKRPDMVISR